MSRVRIQHLAVLGLALAGCESKAPDPRAACYAGSADACALAGQQASVGADGKLHEAEVTEFWKHEVDLRAKACAAGQKDECTRMIARTMVMMPMPLAPPTASPEPALMFGIEIHADGTTSADGKRMADDDALLAAARRAFAAGQDVRAVVRAARPGQPERARRVIEILKQAGFTKIAYGLAAPDAGAAP